MMILELHIHGYDIYRSVYETKNLKANIERMKQKHAIRIKHRSYTIYQIHESKMNDPSFRTPIDPLNEQTHEYTDNRKRA